MKIIFFSDIHGITTNLEKLKEIISSGNFDKIIVLGDLFDYSFQEESIRIAQFLSTYRNKLLIMRGNCDSLFHIEKSSLEFTEDISLLTVDGIDFYLTHGNRYRYSHNDIFTNGVMIYGHEHIPYIKREQDMIYINTGSLSLPRNEIGPTYAIYEKRTFTIYSIIDDRIVDRITIPK